MIMTYLYRCSAIFPRIQLANYKTTFLVCNRIDSIVVIKLILAMICPELDCSLKQLINNLRVSPIITSKATKITLNSGLILASY